MSFFQTLQLLFTSKDKSEKPLFDSEEQIKDIALRLALSGSTLNQERERIDEYYKKKEHLIDLQFKDELDVLNTKLIQIKNDLDEINNLKKGYRARILTVENEFRPLDAEIAKHRQISLGAWQEILQKRYEKGSEFFDGQTKKIAAFFEDDWNELEKGIDHQIKIEEKLFEIQKKNYEINKEEFKRRADKCREEQTKIEAELKLSTDQIEKFKLIGITKYSANFLLIAGFLSLAGAGSIVANLLQDRQPGDDLITWFVKSAGTFVGSIIPSDLAYGSGLIKIGGFIGIFCLFLGFFYSLIRLSDWLIGRFDPSWRESPKDVEELRPKKTKKALGKGFPDNLEEFIGGYQSLKSYFDFIPTSIDRKDYTRLIASFPYIFLISAVIFLLAGHVDDNKQFTLSTAYIGIIFVLMTASCWVVYVTKIIEPRWIKYADELSRQINVIKLDGNPVVDNATNITNTNSSHKESRNGTGKPRLLSKYFWVNWELSLILILMVVSLILAALLPTKTGNTTIDLPMSWIGYLNFDGYKHIVWGSLAIFVSLSSLGLAYGIVQRGLFLIVDDLEIKRNFFRELTERFNFQPVIGGERYYQLTYPEDLTSEYIDLRRQLENQKLFYEANETFAGDYETEIQPNNSDWISIFNKFLHRNKKNLVQYLRRKQNLILEVRPLDFAFARDASHRFVEHKAEIEKLEETKRANEKELKELRQQIIDAADKYKESENSLEQTTKQTTEIINKKLMALDIIRDDRERDLIVFTAAFTVGSIARPLLIEEGIPLPDPPEQNPPNKSSSSTNPSSATVSEEVGNGTDGTYKYKD